MMIEYLCKKNTFNAYISPTFAQGKKVYSELMGLLENTGIIKSANATDLKIESVYGSTLKFFSMESPTSIRGNTVSGLLVLDEAAFFPLQLPSGEDPYYNVIFPIIKARKPKVFVVSTPNGKQGMFYDLYLKAVNGEEGYKEITATIYEDEFISPSEIEELRKGYPKLAFDQEFCCKFLSNALTVFPDYEDAFDIDEWKKTVKCWIGIDPSSTENGDNTILTVVNENNEVRQHNVTGTLDQKYATLARLINQYNPVACYMEDNSIGEVMAHEVQRQLTKKSVFHTFTTTNETKKDYIGLISVNIANGTIHFEKENKLLYSEMGSYTFKLTKAGNITYGAISGRHDDTISSLGLALQCKEDYRYQGVNNNRFVRANIKQYI